MSTILVHVSNQDWTMRAMHLASALARNTHSKVVILYLMQVNNPGLLGESFAAVPLSLQTAKLLKDYAEIAEDYGVENSVLRMQYISTLDAVVQAVDATEASALFTCAARSRIALWEKLQLWLLEQQLTQRECRLCLIENATSDESEWVPFVKAHAAK